MGHFLFDPKISEITFNEVLFTSEIQKHDPSTSSQPLLASISYSNIREFLQRDKKFYQTGLSVSYPMPIDDNVGILWLGQFLASEFVPHLRQHLVISCVFCACATQHFGGRGCSTVEERSCLILFGFVLLLVAVGND